MSNLIKYEEKQQNLNYLRSLAKIASESKQYHNQTEANLLNLMLSAQDMGVSPLKAINGGFYIVHGKVCMSTALMADKIRKAGHSIKIVEMSKDKCTIIAVRKDNGDSLKFEYTMEDARMAGVSQSDTWKKYPKAMLYNRCMSSIARILFPDVVGNSYSEEERFDIQNVPSHQRPLEDPEAEMTIEAAPTIEQKLSEEMCADLDLLLKEHPDAEAKIKERYSIESVYEMPYQDYEKIITWLMNKKKEEVNA